MSVEYTGWAPTDLQSCRPGWKGFGARRETEQFWAEGIKALTTPIRDQDTAHQHQIQRTDENGQLQTESLNGGVTLLDDVQDYFQQLWGNEATTRSTVESTQ